MARGGDVLAPGEPSDPVQFIDARDLAEWTIRVAEQKTTGIYNATGPATPLTMKGMLEGIEEGLQKKVELSWVPADFLAREKAAPWSDMPVWVPLQGEDGGLSTTSIKRALDKGLAFRPLPLTARDTIAWFEAQPKERQANLRAGLPADREKEIIEAWKKK